ncbi:MAG: GspJ family type II secretion system protein [Verrucomicrobia bacterium]|nr:GspJ family type II secretion system protein [Verrucomicrobiota bacterium]
MTAGPASRVRCDSRLGYTLIETILAVAIAALIVLLIFSLYYAVTHTLSGQQSRKNDRNSAVRALEQISEDLTSAYPPSNEAGCEFVLDPGQEAGALLSFCVARREVGVADLEWSEIHRVQYVLDTEGNSGRLLRLVRPTGGPASTLPPVTNILASGVTDLSFSASDGAAWFETWPVSEEGGLPKAMRLRLAAGSDAAETFETDVLIPAAQVISSETVRVSTASSL